jgi:chloramphenicol 3-O-phosphotransferase
MSPTNPRSILLSGPVGAGKTTVAKELIATSQGPTAHIEGDKFWAFTARRRIEKPRLDEPVCSPEAITHNGPPEALILETIVPNLAGRDRSKIHSCSSLR